MQPLTKRQREILDYLQEFIQQHGYAPSLEEIARVLGGTAGAVKANFFHALGNLKRMVRT